MNCHQAPSLKRLGLLNLPIEVRHEIYRHLFCIRPCPITLSSRDPSEFFWLHPPEDEPSAPTFYTAIFRVNKAISRDALQFAYSANSFLASSNMFRFCALGEIALASLRTVSVFNVGWRPTEPSRQMWHCLKTRCPSLELLVLEPSSHLLFLAIPYFRDLMSVSREGEPRPELVLDLHVFDRHFSFNFPESDYRDAVKALRKRSGPDAWDGFMKPRQIAMTIPTHVKQVRLVVDVSPGQVRALEEVLDGETSLGIVKSDMPLSDMSSPLDRLGRKTRICYRWKAPDANDG